MERVQAADNGLAFLHCLPKSSMSCRLQTTARYFFFFCFLVWGWVFFFFFFFPPPTTPLVTHSSHMITECSRSSVIQLTSFPSHRSRSPLLIPGITLGFFGTISPSFSLGVLLPGSLPHQGPFSCTLWGQQQVWDITGGCSGSPGDSLVPPLHASFSVESLPP